MQRAISGITEHGEPRLLGTEALPCRMKALRPVEMGLERESSLGPRDMSTLGTQRAGRGPARFKQRDVTRAIKAMLAAGVQGRVEIETSGKIVVVMGKTDETILNEKEFNEWDTIH
jgi:hypothetical protein